MSEVTDLVVIEKTNALTVFKSSDQIEEIIQKVEREVLSFVPDTSTAKGRKEIASLAYKVAQTKTYLDNLGKDLVAELKEIPKLIDGNRRTVRDRLDALRDQARKPLTDYEKEIERIAAEKAAEEERLRVEAEQKAALEALKKEIEVKHEMALLLNEKFDRDLAEAKAESERQRIAHEEELKRQAAEQARLDAEAKAKAEIDAANKREADAKAKAEAAERQRIEQEAKAERDRIAAEQKVIADRKAAEEKAEREKQQAIEAERRKAAEAEQARLAEEKRIADEKARREADTENRKTINNQVIEILTKAGISPECAKECVIAIVKNQNQAIASGITPPVQINY